MLTGDSASAAQGTAAALGIHEFHAELLPEQKVEQVDAIIQNSDGKSKVVFVGDGINDAPALARAHVGVAMGALGSEAAVETADVVLMTDNPFAVVEAMETAGKTNRIVWQNINLALVVKVVVLLLGAVSAVSLWQAVFADVGVTILTVLNSMRIIRAVRD
jgi:Cd2+/Zn2+-exporting ATPase